MNLFIGQPLSDVVGRFDNIKLPAMLLFFLATALVACGPASDVITPLPSATPSGETVQETTGVVPTGYPAPSTPDSSLDAYPPATEAQNPPTSAYPAPDEPAPSLPLIAFDRPVSADPQVLSGVGPPGLAIIIVNATFMGEVIASGFVGEDSTFSVPVDNLPPGVRIGLMADPESIGLSLDGVLPGDGAINIPQVGFLYDSFVVPQN